MALTYRDFLDRLAQMEGTAFANWSEAQKAVRVGVLNEALRSSWKTGLPLLPFPFTVNSGTVAVTDGKIAPNLLGDGTWCSLWDVDPREAGNEAVEVDAVVSHDGVYPVEEYTSVFAFYRKAVPQGTYAEAGTYATPADIPDDLLDMVTIRALCGLFVSLQQWEAVNAVKGAYGDPAKLRESMVAALIASGMVWQRHALVLTAAAV